METFQRTGERQEKCPQCRTIISNMPFKLIYVNHAHPELSDILTEEEKKEIKKIDNRIARNKKRNKIKKIKRKIKQIKAKIADIRSNQIDDQIVDPNRSNSGFSDTSDESDA
jgi:hypothetical protein